MDDGAEAEIEDEVQNDRPAQISRVGTSRPSRFPFAPEGVAVLRTS
jgi:hypothetical protein